MDNVDQICNGIENLDMMAKQIEQVVMRIADFIDSEATKQSSGLQQLLGHFGHTQMGDWRIYCKKDGSGLAIHVDLSSTGFMLVSSYKGRYEFMQPGRYIIKEIRAKLPAFLARMEADFPEMQYWFKPFYDAAEM